MAKWEEIERRFSSNPGSLKKLSQAMYPDMWESPEGEEDWLSDMEGMNVSSSPKPKESKGIDFSFLNPSNWGGGGTESMGTKDNGDTGILDFLGGSAKNALQGFNPFDDVGMKQAVENQLKLMENPSKGLGQANRTATRFADTMTLGGISALDRTVNNRDAEYFRNVDGFDSSDIGSFLGYLGPGAAGAGLLRGTKLGANLTRGMTKGQRFGQRAKEGAVLGAGLSGIEESIDAVSGQRFDPVNVALNAGLGAVADPLLGLGLDKLIKPRSVTMNGESLPENPFDFLSRTGEYADTSSTARVFNPEAEIYGPGQRYESPKLTGPVDEPVRYNPNQIENNPLGLNEPIRGTRPPEESPILGLEDGSIPKTESTPYGDIPITETKGNGIPRSYWEGRLEEFTEFVRGKNLPSGREQEALEEMWTQFAKPEEPNLNDVIDLATPSLDEFNRFNAGQAGDPLQFKQTKVGRPPEQPENDDIFADLNFSTRQQGPSTATKVEGNFRTEPTNDGVRVTSTSPIDDILEDLQFKKTVEKEVSRGLDEKPKFTSSSLDDFLDNPLGRSDAQPQGQTRSNPGEPLGFMSGARQNNDSPIADPRNLKSNIEQGRTTLSGNIQRSKSNWFSDLQPIKDLERMIYGKNGKKAKFEELDAEESATKGLRSVRWAQGAARNYADRKIKPILQSLRKAKINRKDFEEYLLAKHANDIIRSGDDYELPAGTTPEWVQRTLAKWNGNQVMADAQQDLLAINNEMLDMLKDAGVYSADDIARMRAKHPNYIPMNRDIEKLEKAIGMGGNISKPRKKKGRKGGSEEKVMPLDSTLQNVYLSMTHARRNKAMSKFENLSDVNARENKGYTIRKVNTNKEDVGNLSTISFFKDGKKQVYEVEPEISKMVDDLDVKNTEGIFRGIEEANRLVRMGNTHLNIAFILSSPFRDSQSSLVSSRTKAGLKDLGGRDILDLSLGYLDTALGKNLEKLTGGKIKSYKDYYEANGGLYTGLISSDFQKLNNLNKELMRNPGVKFVNPIKYIEKLGEISEHGQKLAEFRKQKRKGATDANAMFEAVDIIDYSDAGSKSRQVNKFVTYFNAAIRGNTRLAQSFKDHPGRTLARASTFITVPTLINEIRNRTGEWSEKQQATLNNLHDWEKNIYWHVPVDGTDTVLSIPKAPVIGQIFANPVQHLFDYLETSDPDSFDGILKNLGKSLAPPHGVPLVQQLVEVGTNYEFFLGAPVVNDEMARKETSEQYDEDTSEISKWLGGKIDRSPLQVDHMLKGLTGSVGKQLSGLADRALDATGAVDRALPPTETDSNPMNPANMLSKRFTTDELRGPSQSSEVYDIYGKLKEAKENMRSEMKDKIRQKYPNVTNEQITDYIRKNHKNFFPYDKELKKVEQLKDAISKIGQNITNIERNKSMTSEEKRTKIVELRDKEKKLNQIVRDKGYLNNVKNIVEQLDN